jgi:hypothetical protein
MSNNEELLQSVNIQQIAEDGAKIYEKIKLQYDPNKKGKFLAIDVESEKVYFGETSADAVASAREAHPQRVFYVVKIGYDVAETMAKSFVEHS